MANSFPATNMNGDPTLVVLDHGYTLRSATDNELAIYRRNLLDAYRMLDKGILRTMERVKSESEHRARKLCEQICNEIRDISREIRDRKEG